MKKFLLVVSLGLVAACGESGLTENSPPVVQNASLTTPEDTAGSVTLTAEDPEGTALSFVLGAPAHGTVTRDGLTVTYVPAPDFHGSDSLSVTVSDGANTVTLTVAIAVTAVNDAPVASADTVSTDEDASLTLAAAALLSNDSDVDGDTLSVTAVESVTHGSVVLSGATVVFSPEPQFNGTATFSYTLTDGTVTTTGQVTVMVGSSNDAPIAGDDSATVEEDAVATWASSELLGNDTDPDGADLTVTGVANASLGGVLLEQGVVTYTPTANFHGTATFEYTVSDGTLTDTGLVTVTVSPVNDLPVVNAASATTAEDTAVELTLSGADVDGDALTFVLDSQPAHGSLSAVTQLTSTTARVTYTPDPDSTEDDAFTFHATDGTASSAAGTATIDVTLVNDFPVAAPVVATTDEDTAVTVTLSGSDPDGDPLTFSIASGPTLGTVGAVTQLTPTSASVTYTPDANASGDDTFTFVANDGTTDSSSATASIQITPVNDAPVASAQSVTTDEDQAIVITLSGSDIDADSLVFSIVDAPEGGSLSGLTELTSTTASVIYTPSANAHGEDAFTFRVNDGALSSTPQTVTVHVTSVNDVPVAMAGDDETVEDSSVTLTLTGTDDDGDALSFDIVTPPAHGTLGPVFVMGGVGTVTYTPEPDYSGSDSFTFTVSDGQSTSGPATRTVDVRPVNDAPVATAHQATTPEDVEVTLTITGSDPEGSALNPNFLSAPAHGTLSSFTRTSASSFTATYVPAANYNGDDAFTFFFDDGSGRSSAAVDFTVHITPVNDAPQATAQQATTEEDTAATLTLSGADVDGAPLDLVLVSLPAHGTVSAITRSSASAFTVLYTPEANYTGDDVFTFRFDDESLSSATVVFMVHVTPVNDAPVAHATSVNVAEDTAVDITLSGSDVEGDGLVFAIVDPPSSGTVGAIVPLSPTAASVTYTPAANINGQVTFSFTVNDGTRSSANATAAVTIVPVNDPPSISAGSSTTDPDSDRVVTLTGTDPDGDPLTFSIVTPPQFGTLGSLFQVSATSATVTYRPSPGSLADDSFSFQASDGAALSSIAAHRIIVTGYLCGDGAVDIEESCDDGAPAVGGDGCSSSCQVETGYVCSGAPSSCSSVCGDGLVAGDEQCDDGNPISTDGCTTQCRIAAQCHGGAVPGANRYAVDPATGHCYASFDSATVSFTTAQTQCENSGGYLASIASAAEQAVVASVQNVAQTPWIGASDAAAEGTFAWRNLGTSALTYTNFQAGQPTHGGAAPHCLRLQNTASGALNQWMDSSCATTGAFGRICEYSPAACGDGVIQTARAEECDDGNTVSNDGCSSTCTGEIFISEYLEGSTDTGTLRMDAIEFYNPSASRVIMPGLCLLQTYTDGAFSRGNQSAMTSDQKTIEPHGTLSICSTLTAGTPLESRCPNNNTAAGTVNKSFWWFGIQVLTGNDVIVLRCNANGSFPDSSGFLYDVVGQIGSNPAGGWGTGAVTTSNHTLRRKCGPVTRRTDPFTPYDPTPDWDSFPVDTVDDIGRYVCP